MKKTTHNYFFKLSIDQQLGLAPLFTIIITTLTACTNSSPIINSYNNSTSPQNNKTIISDISNLNSQVFAGQIKLNWTYSSDQIINSKGVKILRKTTNDIGSADDNTADVIQTLLSLDYYIDTSALPQTTYYYKIFTCDTSANCSSGVVTQAYISANWTKSLSRSPNIKWTEPDVNLNGIEYYEVAIGTTLGGTNVKSWTNVGKSNYAVISNLNLASNTTYFASVRARNTNGTPSDSFAFYDWSTDTAPPTLSSITTVASPSASSETPTFTWSATDSQSGVGGYKAQVYRASDSTPVSDWVDIKPNDKIKNLILKSNTQYYLKIIATDLVTNESVATNSPYWTTPISTNPIPISFGNNDSFQLGQDNRILKPTHTRPVYGSYNFIQITEGREHTCGITSNGAAYCWGNNVFGQLGDDSTDNSEIPKAVAGGYFFTQIVAGNSHTCGLTISGLLYCWGGSANGQTGYGSTTNTDIPKPVVGGLIFSKISLGAYHTCGITSNSLSYCWGDNIYGQLGDRSNTDKTSPTLVSGGISFIEIISGNYHTCGRNILGQVYCWGYNNYGQLGDSTNVNKNSPAIVENFIFQELALGYEHTCGIRNTGETYCWGRNAEGQLGDNSTTTHYIPVITSGNNYFSKLDAGSYHTCGITLSGTIYCWGKNADGQLGDNSTTNRLMPTEIKSEISFTHFSTSFYHSCGIASSGTAYCWGQNNYGEIGDYSVRGIAKPILVSGGFNFLKISSGHSHSCGLISDGTAYCWGANDYGQLGDGSYAYKISPTAVAGTNKYSEIAAGRFHTCGIEKTSKIVYCWGKNYEGQLGDNTFISTSSPTSVNNASTFAQLSLGEYHSCGITTGGELYCWGYNYYGQIGDETTINKSSPTLISVMKDGIPITFSYISAGSSHTCATSSDGVPYCWGDNYFGQLGDNSQINRLIPTPLFGSYVFSQIVVGFFHSCGLDSIGYIYCWGYNYNGELGRSFTSYYSKAIVAISGSINFSSISAGSGHTCGIEKTTNKAFCWGNNFNGQLGDNSFDNKYAPVAVSGDYTYTQISAGGSHTLGIINPP